jgi:hypothetical protein
MVGAQQVIGISGHDVNVGVLHGLTGSCPVVHGKIKAGKG